MNEAIAPTVESHMLPPVKPEPFATDKLLSAFVAGRCPATMKAYNRDLADFAVFVNVNSVDAAAETLLGEGQGEANRIVLDYRAHLESRGLAPATVRRRLASLRALCKVGRLIGVIAWKLDVPAPKVSRVRDTRGTGLDGFRKLLAAARAQKNPAKAARDAAMVRLMGDRGLRRAEVTGLDMADLDLDGERIAVRGKGLGGQREWITVAPQTIEVIHQWLEMRSGLGLNSEGAVFVNLAHAGERRRISTTGVYEVFRKLGEAAGLKRWNPHGLRHAAITAILDLTSGDLRSAQRFARHADPNTTLAYDDNRKDVAGEAARLLAAAV